MRTAVSWLSPQVRGLAERAVTKLGYLGSPEALVQFTAARIAAADLGVFVGYAGGVPAALAIIALPTTPYMMVPQLLLAYNEQRPALARAVAAAMRRWLVAEGYHQALAATQAPVAAMMRVSRHFGTPAHWGAVIAYEF